LYCGKISQINFFVIIIATNVISNIVDYFFPLLRKATYERSRLNITHHITIVITRVLGWTSL
jgi:hypothetical protein